jgi:hypothetical protein
MICALIGEDWLVFGSHFREQIYNTFFDFDVIFRKKKSLLFRKTVTFDFVNYLSCMMA